MVNQSDNITNSQVSFFSIFVIPFIYCLFMEQCIYIFSCWNTFIYSFSLMLLVCKLYVLNVTHSCMYLPNPFAWARCNTSSIFKQSLTGLNSEFSFSKTSCHTKFKVPSPYYLPIAGERIVGFISFLRVSSTMWNANSFIQDLKWSTSQVH